MRKGAGAILDEVGVPEGLGASEQAMLESVRELAQRIRSLPESLDKGAQKEAAALLNLIPDVLQHNDPRLFEIIHVGISALTRDPPSKRMARDLRIGVARQVALKKRLRSLLLGLGIGGYLSLVVIGFVLFSFFEGPVRSEIVLVGLAGAVGASVSIAIRIRDISRLKGADHELLFYTGFLKPLIGIAFALFVYSAIRSGVITVTAQEYSGRLFFFAAVGFTAGFSERLAKDVLSRLEGRVIPSDEDSESETKAESVRIPEEAGSASDAASVEAKRVSNRRRGGVGARRRTRSDRKVGRRARASGS